jgi:hypothetical protein
MQLQYALSLLIPVSWAAPPLVDNPDKPAVEVAAHEPGALDSCAASKLPLSAEAPVAADIVALTEGVTEEGVEDELTNPEHVVSETGTRVHHHGHGHSHGGSLSVADTDSPQFPSAARIILLELGVAVHSVFVGFSVGALP